MSPRRLSATDLTSTVRLLASCPAAWADHAEHDPDHRLHARLTVGDGWEAYLITWPSGHGVELHDHGGSAGAVAVVAGSLVELVARRPTPRSRPTSPARHRLGAGTVRPVPPGRVHDVLNAERSPATSIHVYGPALETMTFYDDGLRPVRTETVYPEPPLLALDEVEDLLGRAAASPS
ncbi:cysteine dioxygenase [Iamia sp. SCSIO 61187]|uniref:cysteine dioxygenase n=1 Tax=Iamia sp. SCSIO 61187 TaxID=2722752 RepID=UPI001C62E33E|nr:cysteine dioxygenase family protein [Iamia sp. SCSIO 61187]QYG92128.1 cysteine dioxygenase [Iamia sp. SCSIO 61187]